MTTQELLELSDRRGYLHLPADAAGGIDALAVQLPSGRCAWAVERSGISTAVYRDKVSHELGHCERSAFYTRFSAPTTREKCEQAAKRWQYRNMVPLSALASAIRDGDREAWQIAERIDLPERLIREAVRYYREALGKAISP